MRTMRPRTPRAAAAAIAAVCAAVVGWGAIGAQGEAPAPPVGTLQIDATSRPTPSTFGINRVSRRAQGPHVGDILVSNGTFVEPGGRRGTWHSTRFVTDQGNGRPNARGVKYTAFVAFDFGHGDTLFASAFISPSDLSGPDAPVPGTVLGGTGRFAGARGTGVQTVLSDTRTALRSRFTFTFMP
jgi:hypothetical protein